MQNKPDQDIEAALKRCASEAVHIPGAIQPHGALIAVSNQTLEICYASDNTGDFLRVSADKLLGKAIGEVFGSKARHEIANAMMLRAAGENTSDLGPIEFGGTSLLVTASAAQTHTIFEVETPPQNAIAVPNSLKDLEFLMAQADASSSPDELFNRSSRLLQMLTGYDRVLVLAFDDDEHGNIVAESLGARVDPLLGRRFPSWDIPAQARALMIKLPLRYIADSSARPVPVLPAPRQLGELEMSYAHLRAAAPIHLEYLRNMGVAGSLTLSIVIEGRLWGMVCFHHETPRYPSQRIRQMCRSYSGFLALKLSNLLRSSDLLRLQKPDILRRKLSGKSAKLGLEKIFETELLKDLMDAMDSDGAVLIYNQTVSTVGKVPPQKVLETFGNECDVPEGVTTSTNISLDFPRLARRVGSKYAGLLVAKLPENCAFLFFREGRDRVVKWAGVPRKTVTKVSGRAQLHPRASFSEYLELVKGTSDPWTSDQVRIAEDLSTVLLTRERADLIRNTNRQQSLLIDELNHRVRNIFALMRSLSQQSLTHNGSIESYAAVLGARISTLASAHDLGAENTELRATLKQIIEQEAAPYNQVSERVKISGFDSGIRADLAPIFALVMHELMTNAGKYGALSAAAGTIDVILVQTETGTELDWRERDGPPVVKPSTKGFGTRLIERSVPHELGGVLRCDFLPSGLSVQIALPSDSLVDMLSAEAPDAQAPSIPTADQKRQKPDITGEICLLLEDSYLVSLDTEHVLKRVGFDRVETALTAQDALDQIKRRAPGIAILDINLSQGKTSEPVARELTARGVPFIFVTGDGDTKTLGDAFRKSPILKKPVRENELRRMVREITK